MGVWTYNGSNSVQFDSVYNDAEEAFTVNLGNDSGGSIFPHSGGSIGSAFSLSDDVGAMTAGDYFYAYAYFLHNVIDTTNGNYNRNVMKEIALFQYGTAGGGEINPVSISYDGVTSISFSVKLDEELSGGLSVIASDPNSTVYTDATPGSPGSTVTVPNAITDIGGIAAGDQFVVSIDAASVGTLYSHHFTLGVAASFPVVGIDYIDSGAIRASVGFSITEEGTTIATIPVRVSPSSLEAAQFVDSQAFYANVDFSGHDCYNVATPNYTFVEFKRWTMARESERWLIPRETNRWNTFEIAGAFSNECLD